MLRPEGLGLGLAIARAIALAHGGRLSAHSDGPGQGTTFTFDLPTTTNAEPIPPLGRTRPRYTSLSPPHAYPARGRQPPSPATSSNVSSPVEATPFSPPPPWPRPFPSPTSKTSTSSSAISASPTAPASPSCAASRLRPISGIALSGFGTDHDRAQSLDAGFAEHLTKPIDFPTLEASLAAAPPPPTRLIDQETGSGFTATV